MQEVWKDVAGYEGYYQVSNMGRVKGLDRYIRYSNGLERKVAGIVLKPNTDKDGYKTVTLTVSRKPKTYKVHRLVAQAFVENPNNYPVINHIDEDKSNNSAGNLEWCTIGYNNEYGSRINQNKKPVMQLSLEGKPIRLWESAIECERVNGYSSGNISRCCNGAKYYKTYKGYRWAWG